MPFGVNSSSSSDGPTVYSPDKKLVAFSKTVNRLESDLWVGEEDGEGSITSARRLFDPSFRVVDIEWSPDSRQVAFIDASSPDTPETPSKDRLLVVDVKTSTSRVLAEEDEGAINRILLIEKWTGDKIIFAVNGFVQDCTQGPCRDLTPFFEIKSDGSGLRQIAP
jgi:Tol biopolymer transport system component